MDLSSRIDDQQILYILKTLFLAAALIYCVYRKNKKIRKQEEELKNNKKNISTDLSVCEYNQLILILICDLSRSAVIQTSCNKKLSLPIISSLYSLSKFIGKFTDASGGIQVIDPTPSDRPPLVSRSADPNCLYF